MSYIGSELRYLRREVTRLNRKLALQRVAGKVVDRKGNKVKLEISEDPQTGKKIVTPWVRVQTLSSGNFKFFVLPSHGEQMYLESASGIIGVDSLATFGSFDDENKQPEMEQDEMLLQVGKTSLSIKDGQIKISVGGSSMIFTPEGIKAQAEKYNFE